MILPRARRCYFHLVTIASGCLALSACSGSASTRGPRNSGQSDDVTTGPTRTTMTVTRSDGTRDERTLESPRSESAWGALEIPVAPPPPPDEPAPRPQSAGQPPQPAPPAALAPPTALSIRPPPDDGAFVEGKASRYQVQAVIEDNRSRIESCTPRSRGMPVEGTILLSFRLGQEGQVGQVSVVRSSYAEAAPGECLKRIVSTLRVIDGKGGTTNVVLPVRLGASLP